MLTPEEIAEIFTYDPTTGRLFWKKRISQKSTIGSVAGSVYRDRRVIVTVNYRHYKAHRVAWAIMMGEWPKNEIDHINGNPSDNRWENLREATRKQNMKNLSRPITNKSGYKGVSWHAIGKKWQAHIKADGVNHYLGLFKTAEEAHKAYCEAADKFHKAYASYGNR